MKHFLTLFILIATFAIVQAQQPAQYSLYMLNPMAWNPGYAGLDKSLSITGVFRKQWTGLEGSPTTQNLSAHLPVYILGGGLGINVENDVLGAQQWTGATLGYAYHKSLGGGILSLGVSAGIVQWQLDGGKIRTPDGVYTEPRNFDHNDVRLPLGAESAMVPTAHVGIYFMNEWMEAGFSVRHLNEGKAAFSTIDLLQERSYNFNLGFRFYISDNLAVQPSALVRSDLTQLQTDFSVILRYNDNIFGGASFRGYDANSIDAVAILAGFKLSEKLTLAYGYDITLSKLNTVSNGSHEITLNYNLNKIFNKGRLPNVIYNPRSL